MEFYLCELFHPLDGFSIILLPYPEFRVDVLQIKSVWSIPVAIDNVCFSITIEVS